METSFELIYSLSETKVDAAIDAALDALDALRGDPNRSQLPTFNVWLNDVLNPTMTEDKAVRVDAWLDALDVNRAHPAVITTVLMVLHSFSSPSKTRLIDRFRPVLEKMEDREEADRIKTQVLK